jgi:hypothetical protein
LKQGVPSSALTTRAGAAKNSSLIPLSTFLPGRNGLCVYLKASVSLAETNKMKRRLAGGRWRAVRAAALQSILFQHFHRAAHFFTDLAF